MWYYGLFWGWLFLQRVNKGIEWKFIYYWMINNIFLLLEVMFDFEN